MYIVYYVYMIKLTIITLGSLKESYWKDAQKEYTKRLGQYTKLNIIELKEESFSNVSERESIRAKEAEKIIKSLPKECHLIALDEHGKEMDSTSFSKLLFTTIPQGTHIVFVIGGPLGLHEIIKKKAHITLSFSQLTFTHQMMRIFLLEQIYRAGTIAHQKQYHY